MTTFPAYATNFELHPKEGEAAQHLAPLVSSLGRIDFAFRVADPTVNQGPTACNFDCALARVSREHIGERWEVEWSGSSHPKPRWGIGAPMP